MSAPLPGPRQSGPDPFAGLDAGLPLLLLPIRLETRFVRRASPPQLRIRVYPDQIHIDADRPGASTGEIELTIRFWRGWHAARGDRARQKEWRDHVARVGAERAGHLARLLRPMVDRGVLRFPEVGGKGERGPAGPVLLPDRWLAVGYSAAGELFRVTSRPVAAGLRTAPDPGAPPWQAPGSGLKIDEALAWMFDYDRAVEVGMAITVPLTGAAAGALDGIERLLVVGVAASYEPAGAAAELDRLLAAHARTGGLAFVPQGTPTNSTESAGTGATPGGRAEDELDSVTARPGENGHRLANALGLAGTGTLARAPYGTDRERDRSRAMVRVMFEALLGTFTRDVLRVRGTPAISRAAVAALRDWCVTHVTGGAPYPCVRIGPQPYGVLPVRRSTSPAEPDTTAEHVQHVVSLLIGEWRRAAAGLPRLDPNYAGEGDIATVLATQPHPARLFSRRLHTYSSLNPFERALTPNEWYATAVERQLDLASDTPLTSPYSEIAVSYAIISNDVGIDSIDTQVAVWEEVRRYLPDQLSGEPLAEGLSFVDTVLALLRGYRTRQEPVRRLDLLAFEGVLGEPGTELIEGLLEGSAREWGDTGLIQAPNAPPGHTAADYLTDLRRRYAERNTAGMAPPALDAGFLDRQPLLYQLLDRTLPLAPDDPALPDALDLLATRTPEELDWLLRESLGLGTHRLDAWATSLATERLRRLRAARPTGIQIGAYGWVTDLRPRDRDVESAGFVHAPSMAHATTAALLRAGWLAHGSDDPLSPAAVAYTSARVRTASWLLDGLRQGQTLGALLGYRFERALHDRNADAHIHPTRERVLAATGRAQTPPDQPVDGIELLDLHRAGRLGEPAADVAAALAEIEDAFDATNDVALVEAVHQLAAGNTERATATLGAMAGTHAPPELRAPRSRRAGTTVEHRVLILLDPGAAHPGRGWVTGVRDRVAPELDTWVAGLLPPAGQVGFTVPGQAMTLADLGLSALDAIYLAGDDPAVAAAPLAALAAARLGVPSIRVEPSEGGTAPITLTEFAVLAIELRRAIESLRVADSRDVRPGHTAGEPELDDSAALDAVRTLVAEFGTITQNPAQLARYGLADPDPARLAAASARRHATVLATEVDAADPRPGLRQRLAALVGGRVPLLGRFPVDLPFQPPVAGPDDVDTWLHAAAKVRPDVGRLVTAGMLSELLADDGGLHARAAQLPAVSGDPWAALGPVPAGTGGRLSIVAVGTPLTGGVACGLAVDGWSERVPGTEQHTGLALQFDAPGNRPPQAWLLAVTPDGEPWSRQLVLDTLTETLEWAALRPVGTEDLLAYGRAVPTVYVPGGMTPWPGEEASDE
ncbi:hypothetical protein Aph01nite_61430 [Acrocarpospora phusangensis]|uniref:Uncharacterized protein n=1 Tax=Acrocarpospora phusangensis TaxID=1070424 RepID=A0A919QFI9_9ACTN|nr:hypothetical protein [Acrocarpospora phusangensis]GIH27833.1 hypothetical protein Aph01nite_61430 [Acrocarpospora phusangensis]